MVGRCTLPFPKVSVKNCREWRKKRPLFFLPDSSLRGKQDVSIFLDMGVVVQEPLPVRAQDPGWPEGPIIMSCQP
jgi:hypothetical protein